MKRNPVTTLFPAVALAVGTLGMVGAAQAHVAYPGAACTAASGRHNDLYVNRNGEVFNKNTSNSLDVVCPVLLFTTGIKIDVNLYVKKPNTSNASCFLHSRFSDGSGGAVKSVNFSGSGLKIVSFLNAPQYSSVSVGCQLPRASSNSSGRTGLIHYFVTEH